VTASVERFLDTGGDVAVRGTLEQPSTPSPDALVLTHGASGNHDAPLLRAVAAAFVARGIVVLRCDLPFRQARPKGPPSPGGAARDRAGLRRAVEIMRARVRGRVLLGGASYGGRQAKSLRSWTGSCSSPTRCTRPGVPTRPAPRTFRPSACRRSSCTAREIRSAPSTSSKPRVPGLPA
jgi:predicted alpha/beta-fold hydrolase